MAWTYERQCLSLSFSILEEDYVSAIFDSCKIILTHNLTARVLFNNVQTVHITHSKKNLIVNNVSSSG